MRAPSHTSATFRGRKRPPLGFKMSLLATSNGWGGSRIGAGRHAKPLLDHARDWTFSAAEHERLLAVDDSVIVAAQHLPRSIWLGALAACCLGYRGLLPGMPELAGDRECAEAFR